MGLLLSVTTLACLVLSKLILCSTELQLTFTFSVKKVFPWIERDIELAQTCLVDDMLRVFLQRASDNPNTEQPDLLATCLKKVVRVLSAASSAGDFHPSRIKEHLAE